MDKYIYMIGVTLGSSCHTQFQTKFYSDFKSRVKEPRKRSRWRLDHSSTDSTHSHLAQKNLFQWTLASAMAVQDISWYFSWHTFHQKRTKNTKHCCFPSFPQRFQQFAQAAVFTDNWEKRCGLPGIWQCQEWEGKTYGDCPWKMVNWFSLFQFTSFMARFIAKDDEQWGLSRIEGFFTHENVWSDLNTWIWAQV